MYETSQTELSNDLQTGHLQTDTALPDLTAMQDEALQTLVKAAQRELEKRKRQREKATKEQIRKMAAEAGITISFGEEKPARKRRVQRKIEGKTGGETGGQTLDTVMKP